jgi:hypothetical protein
MTHHPRLPVDRAQRLVERIAADRVVDDIGDTADLRLGVRDALLFALATLSARRSGGRATTKAENVSTNIGDFFGREG